MLDFLIDLIKILIMIPVAGLCIAAPGMVICTSLYVVCIPFRIMFCVSEFLIETCQRTCQKILGL